ncbi:MAG: CRISPR-associated RAMP protein [Chloroflexi bacterium]|nr:CRISPR-associated RAMP protein [Chloroflexota bacterium]
MNLDRIFNQVVLDVGLKVNRTLLVGSGQGDITPGGVDIPQIRMTTSQRPDVQGEPYVPGSSLKGAIRSTCETVIRTFVDGYKGSGVLCYDDAPEEKTVCGKENAPLCMMCDTFGNTNRISKVSFDDAFLTDAALGLLSDAVVQHRTGVSISRKTGAAKSGALFSVEFVPRGAEFEFKILCTNILPAELKLLLLALELFNQGRFKLGGQKSRGMGSVTFEVCGITTYLPKLYRFDPFAREDGDGGYRWLSGSEVLERIIERPIDETAMEELVTATVVYEVPAGEDWATLSSDEGQAYLRGDLIPRLYPLTPAEDGTFHFQVQPQGDEDAAVLIGRYDLRAGGDLSQVQIEEQINQMEYAITQTQRAGQVLEENYRSAFEFLSSIEKESRASEELRLPGLSHIPTRFRQADGTAIVLKVTDASRRAHDLLVWLGWAQMLIAPVEGG